MKKYTNRYGDKFTFELNKRNNLQWSGEFRHCRMGFGGDPDDICRAPAGALQISSGGPYICLDTDMKSFGFPDKKVVGFIKNDDGFEIVLRK